MCTFDVTFFSFIKSRSLKIRYHVPSTVEPGKESLTFTLGSEQLDGQIDHVAALGSSLSVVLLLVFEPRHFDYRVSLGGYYRGRSREAISSYVLPLVTVI